MIAFFIIALLTLASAAVAMSLRNLIHSALLLIASWAGIAAFYLWAGAEFVAFAQVLVYVGAVSMVVLFAVLLTRRSRADLTIAPDYPSLIAELEKCDFGSLLAEVKAEAASKEPTPVPPAGSQHTQTELF